MRNIHLYIQKRSKRGVPLMLEETRMQEIEAKANSIISSHGLAFPGFDLAQFLTNTEGFVLGEQPMNDDTTGLILVNDAEFVGGTTSHRLISTNTNLRSSEHFIQRRRFIVAHEYGHLILHKASDERLFAHRDSGERDTPKELEADYFARCLLMPRSLVQAAVQSFIPSINKIENETEGESDIVNMVSSMFNVTPKKARIRLNELNLIKGGNPA